MKKILSILLTAMIMAAIMIAPITTAFAAEHSLDFGGGITGTFDDSTGILTVSGTGTMDDFSLGSSPTYAHRNDITSIIVENGVSNLGNHVFYRCENATSLTIPTSVTSIGEGSLYSCTGLTSLTIPTSVTSIAKDGLKDCKALTSLTIPDSVDTIGDYAFSGCDLLQTVNMPTNITSIGKGLVSRCYDLNSITLPNGITTLGSSFFGDCSSLVSITIPNGVLIIDDNVFKNCTSLATVIIPDSVTSIDNYAFAGCSTLPSITLPSSISNIGDRAFQNCCNLATIINLYDGQQTIADVPGGDAFENVGTSVSGSKTAQAEASNTTFITAIEAKGFDIVDPPVISTGQTMVESTIPVEGTVDALTISVTHPLSVEYTINPNLGEGNAFIAPNISITNNTKVPVNVTVKSLTSATGGTLQFTDVAHDAQDWVNLNLADSKTYICLGIKIADGTGWDAGYNTESFYGITSDPVAFGSLAKDSTASMQMTANHGLAFAQSYTAVHNLIFLFNLV